MVREVSDAAEFAREIRGPGLVVVDFFMDSCGPCKMIAPILEQLAARHPTVKFIKVSVDRNEDVCRSRNVGAFPTFQFFVRGNFVDELKGADPSALESKIIKYKKDADPFAGKGKTLGAPTGDAPLDPRAARLKALGISDDSSSNPRPAAAASSASKPASAAAMDVDNEDEEDEAIAKAIALSIQEAKGAGAGVTTHSNSKGTIVCDGNKCTVVKSAAGSKDAETMPMDMDISNTIVGSSAPAVPLGKSSVKSAAEQDAEDDAEAHAALQAEHDADTAWGEEMVPVPVNDELLSQLIDMGFSDVVSRKGLTHGGSLEGALAWIEEHQGDPDIDQPYMVRKSDVMPKPPMSAEEKAKRLQEMKKKIQERRAERSQAEKATEQKREKERIERGKMMQETQEERDRLARKREAEKQKKEKEAARLERERLRAELARDKEIRKLNKGVLPSVLGVDGYNPSIVQYDVPLKPGAAPAVAAEGKSESKPAAAPAPAKPTSSSSSATEAKPALKVSKPAAAIAAASSAAPPADPEEVVDNAIQTIMKYRTGGDGGQALKLLYTFVKNVVENPTESKYRSINMESNAFKTKVAPFMGTLALLKAVGFQKDDVEAKLVLKGDSPLLASTATKLAKAEETYRAMNP